MVGAYESINIYSFFKGAELIIQEVPIKQFIKFKFYFLLKNEILLLLGMIG